MDDVSVGQELSKKWEMQLVLALLFRSPATFQQKNVDLGSMHQNSEFKELPWLPIAPHGLITIGIRKYRIFHAQNAEVPSLLLSL
jgi:hypothetical protein